MTPGPTGGGPGGSARTQYQVAVVGPHILDVLGRPVEAIPPGQGSARLTEIKATAAGTAAGTAVDLAKLGAGVACFGAVGTDLIADILVGALATFGIDTSGLVRTSAAQTSATILPIRPNGERPALHVPGATRAFRATDFDLTRLARYDALLLGGPDALAGLSGADLTAIAAAAKDGGALVVADVLHPGSRPDLDRLAGALSVTDWFCPNSDQLLALTGRSDLELAISDVLALGTGGVAVTLGADGCLVSVGGTVQHIPAIKVAVVDTTGCGDAFNAGLLLALLHGCAAADAAWLGVACGSLVATGLGSDAGLESIDQALDFLTAANTEVAARIAAATARGSV